MKESTRCLVDLVEKVQKFQAEQRSGRPWNLPKLSAEVTNAEERLMEAIRTELEKIVP